MTGEAGVERQPSGASYLRLILLGAAIGIPAALIGAGFLGFVHYLERWLWTDLPHALGASSPPWYLVIGLPAAGALVVVAARTLLPGDGGHPPLEGLNRDPTPMSHAPGVALAALGTLAFGAVLGPEAPVIALGSVVGVAAARLARAKGPGGQVLSTAGSFSAISALFGGPIVAGMLMLEAGIGLGESLIPALVPGFVAAAVGYVIFIGFGHWGGLNAPGLLIPSLPPYTSIHPFDLVASVIVGVVTALLMTVVKRLATAAEGRGERRLGMVAFLVLGALAVGALAEVARLLGANSQDVLFSGQTSIPALVAADSIKILVVLLVAKALAYAISLACGFRGGPIFPSMFLGVAVASIATVLFHASPTLAVVVGAGAGMAAETRLVFAPILFAVLLVGKPGLAAEPAAVLGTVAAWATVTVIARRGAPPASTPTEAPPATRRPESDERQS